MTVRDIINLRFSNQYLIGRKFDSVQEEVGWFGAVQAQDYPNAKWALSLRLNGQSSLDIGQEFNKGKILRTHVMRPTWHFVLPKDIRWMLTLTSPRVKRLMTSYNKRMGLDDAEYEKANRIIAKALQGGKHLTRTELAKLLNDSGVITKTKTSANLVINQRLTHLMMNAELDGIICSGPVRDKNFTYALLDERVQNFKKIEREEALFELAKRYFQSHGPATIEDFVWWSGLSSSDAKIGLESNKSKFESEVVDGKTYWFAPFKKIVELPAPNAFLMSVYDEYIIAYKSRGMINDPLSKLVRGNAVFNLVFVIDGVVRGTWKRVIKKDTVEITIKPFEKLNRAEEESLRNAVDNYGKFLDLKVAIQG